MAHSRKLKTPGFLREWMEAGTFKPDTPRLAKLKRRSAELQEDVSRLEAAMHDSAHWLIEEGTAAVIANARVQSGRKSGGIRTAKALKVRAQERHATWIDTAQKLIKSGMRQRDVSACVARRNGVTARQVRGVLQQAGVIKTRK